MMHSPSAMAEEVSRRRPRDIHSPDGRPGSVDPFILRVMPPDMRRVLIKEGDVVKVGRRTNALWHLWLFSDSIVFGSKDGSTYKLERKLSIATCSVSIFRSCGHLHALEISDEGRSFVVLAPTRSLQMEWLGHVSNATASLRSSPTSMIAVNLSGAFAKFPEAKTAATSPIRRNSWGIDVYDGAVGGDEFDGVITSVGLSPSGQKAASNSPQACTICDQTFGSFKPKHNCTDCGNAVCSICSIPPDVSSTKIRVCDDCWMPVGDEGISDLHNDATHIEHEEELTYETGYQSHSSTSYFQYEDSSSSASSLLGGLGGLGTSLMSRVNPLAHAVKKAMKSPLLSPSSSPLSSPPRPQVEVMVLMPSKSTPSTPPPKPTRNSTQNVSHSVTAKSSRSSSNFNSTRSVLSSSVSMSSSSTSTSTRSVIDFSSVISSAVYEESHSASSEYFERGSPSTPKKSPKPTPRMTYSPQVSEVNVDDEAKDSWSPPVLTAAESCDLFSWDDVMSTSLINVATVLPPSPVISEVRFQEAAPALSLPIVNITPLPTVSPAAFKRPVPAATATPLTHGTATFIPESPKKEEIKMVVVEPLVPCNVNTNASSPTPAEKPKAWQEVVLTSPKQREALSKKQLSMVARRISQFESPTTSPTKKSPKKVDAPKEKQPKSAPNGPQSVKPNPNATGSRWVLEDSSLTSKNTNTVSDTGVSDRGTESVVSVLEAMSLAAVEAAHLCDVRSTSTMESKVSGPSVPAVKDDEKDEESPITARSRYITNLNKAPAPVSPISKVPNAHHKSIPAPTVAEKHATNEKYDFMRSMKIPEGTIRQMMTADGLSTCAVQAYSPVDSTSVLT